MDDPPAILLDRIYEAAVIPERWAPVLGDVAASAGGFGTLLSVVSPTGRNRWVTSSVEMDDLVRAHLEYFPQNARTTRLLATRHAGFIVDSDVLTDDEMAEEPVYRDYLLPRGFGYGAATAIHAPSGDATVVHVEGRRADGPLPRPAVLRLDALRPHLARAALVANRLEVERARNAVAALELVGLPAAVLGGAGRAIAANDLMQRLMPAAVQDLPSRLKLTEAGADALFAAALAALGSGAARVTVRSVPMRAQEDRPPIIFHLAPVRGAARDVFSRALAILVATPVTPRPALGVDLVQGLFDLTPAEAKLASLVAGGHPPREAAAALGWTEATARTTLKQVFAKTGVSRQAELVALLGGRVAL